MLWLVLTTSALQFLAELVYVRNTLHGRSQPNRITFFLWALNPAVAIAAGLSVGETWALLPVFMVGFGPFLILLASFWNKNAYWKLGRFDYLSGLLSLLSLALWALTQEPAIAVLFAILADFFASLPTLVKGWKYPETETGISYALSFVNALAGVTLLTSFDFANSGFLFFTVFINFCLAFSVYKTNPLQKFRDDFSRRKDL